MASRALEQGRSALGQRRPSDIAARAQAGSWTRGFGYAIALFLSLRLAIWLFSLALSTVMPLYDACSAAPPVVQPASVSPITALFGVWRQWDSCWYERIAASGYEPGSIGVAFFPLFPMAMRIVAVLLGGNVAAAGYVVAGAGYIAAMVGLYRLACRDFDEGIARRAVLALSVFPSALALFIPYTESCFLALAIWTISLARRGNWWWATALAFLASLTRTQGCLLALPLAWEVWRQRQQFAARCVLGGRVALVAGAPLGGLGLFLGYSWAALGWTTFQAQQAGWSATYAFPWATLYHSARQIAATGNAVEAGNLALLVLFVALFCAGLRRVPFSYSLYVAPQLFLLTIRQVGLTPLSSASRYLLVLFPIFIILAFTLREWRYRLWLACSLTLLAAMVALFLLGAFVV